MHGSAREEGAAEDQAVMPVSKKCRWELHRRVGAETRSSQKWTNEMVILPITRHPNSCQLNWPELMDLYKSTKAQMCSKKEKLCHCYCMCCSSLRTRVHLAWIVCQLANKNNTSGAKKVDGSLWSKSTLFTDTDKSSQIKSPGLRAGGKILLSESAVPRLLHEQWHNERTRVQLG